MAEDMATRLRLRVKNLRLGLNLTQEAFAHRAGIRYKYYQAIEAGRKKNMRLFTLQKLAWACRLELWRLFKFDSEPKPTKRRVRLPKVNSASANRVVVQQRASKAKAELAKRLARQLLD